METYYQVTYITEKGLEVTYKRDTVERAYYLYKSLKNDEEYNIKLEEVSNNGIALLRGEGCYKVVEAEKVTMTEKPTTKPTPKRHQTMFEMMFGITKEEYNECLTSWNRLTRDNVDLL